MLLLTASATVLPSALNMGACLIVAQINFSNALMLCVYADSIFGGLLRCSQSDSFNSKNFKNFIWLSASLQYDGNYFGVHFLYSWHGRKSQPIRVENCGWGQKHEFSSVYICRRTGWHGVFGITAFVISCNCSEPREAMFPELNSNDWWKGNTVAEKRNDAIAFFAFAC
jgi:hypothetical protein